MLLTITRLDLREVIARYEIHCRRNRVGEKRKTESRRTCDYKRNIPTSEEPEMKTVDPPFPARREQGNINNNAQSAEIMNGKPAIS